MSEVLVLAGEDQNGSMKLPAPDASAELDERVRNRIPGGSPFP